MIRQLIKRRKTIIDQMDLSSDDYISYLKTSDIKDRYIATFGDRFHDNCMMLYLDGFHVPCNIILMNAKAVYDGQPVIKTPEDGIKRKLIPNNFIEEDAYHSPLIIDVFEVYLEDDGLSFLFGAKEVPDQNSGVVFHRKSNLHRVMYGFDSNDQLKYLRINDLTEEERRLFCSKLKRKGVPLEKKAPLNPM